MRRWQLLNRLFRAPDPRPWDRCVPVVEQLETRENPAPVIGSPNFGESIPETLEDNARSFQDSESFSVNNSAALSNVHRATLTAVNGTITVGAQNGVTVAGNGTSTVVLTGLIGNINTLIVNGYTYTPTDFYSGEATVQLAVTDLGVDEQGNPTSATGNASSSFTLRVRPVVSPANLSVAASEEVWAPSGGFAFPPGFVSVTSWPDADGSETATIGFSLDADDPGAFRLFAGGVEQPAIEPGFWLVSVTSQAALDSLVLVPPSGFTGRASLFVSGSLSDTANYPSFPPGQSSETDTNFELGFGSADLRFFLGGNVTLPPVSGPEGGTLDLGGRFVATDPDELDGDSHTLTLSVPGGLFTFSDAALVEGMSAARDVATDGSTTITLSGNLDAINAFLATPGSLLYSPPDPDFSGVLPLTITLANRPGEPPFEGSEGEGQGSFASLVVSSGPGEAPGKFGGVAALVFAPSADRIFPLADDAVTNEDTPVAVSIGLAPLPTDASESVLIVVEGVPPGASFNNGTDLGGGVWALAVADLAGLVFNPPPGASGVFAFSVKAIVTDSDPATGTFDTATESTGFTVTVNPVADPVPDPDPVIDPPDLPPDFDEGSFGDFDGTLVSDEFDDAVSAGDEDGQPGDRDEEPLVLPEAFATSTERAGGPAEDRVGSALSGPGSLFANPESPLPSYSGGEKHPLPPVLPLDQTSPVAGFTESGGDSFALIDKLYRDGTAQRADAKPDEAVVAAPAPDAVPVAQVAMGQIVVAAAEVNSAVGAGVAVNDPDSAGGDWRVWVAGTAMAGALGAWAWMSRARKELVARVRRFLHPARRPIPTET